MTDESGADLVEDALLRGGSIGSANWSEIAQKVIQHGRRWDPARALLMSYPIEIEPVTAGDAERAALLWKPDSGLSLGDRLCLALGDRLDVHILTADRSWGSGGRIRQIR